jgi:hypothetical protein
MEVPGEIITITNVMIFPESGTGYRQVPSLARPEPSDHTFKLVTVVLPSNLKVKILCYIDAYHVIV